MITEKGGFKMENIQLKAIEAAEFIMNNTKYRPEIGIILGSGLGEYGDTLKNAEYLNYNDIPNFPVSTVEGHKGRFVITDKLICMQGRFHYYEGYDMGQVTFPIRVMKKLGVESLIMTNASGGVNETFKGGDLMIITDHINLMGNNPLIGKNLDEFGTRFPDMSNAYDKEYIKIAESAANRIGMEIKKGVYAGFSGPNYETPAEVRMARILGGDAVGMSTVPEAIVATHCQMRILGISCITNMAAGVSKTPLNHKEVTETAEKVKSQFIGLLEEVTQTLQ